jgi:O-antigen ligase
MNRSYHYLDNLRLQLWFDSPNHCAAFLVMTIMLSIGVLLHFACRDEKPHWVFVTVMFCAVFGQEALLALTYSRGGYLALLASLPLMWLFCRRKRLLIFNLVFLALLLVTANGIDRIQSVMAVDDGSIKHRLLLWEGGLSIIWNNPIAGVGADSIGKTYTAWHQTLWLNEAYKTLVNDYLTIGAAYGIIALFAYLTVILTGLWLGFKRWKDTKNPLLLSVLGGIIAYLLAAVFTRFLRFDIQKQNGNEL